MGKRLLSGRDHGRELTTSPTNHAHLNRGHVHEPGVRLSRGEIFPLKSSQQWLEAHPVSSQAARGASRAANAAPDPPLLPAPTHTSQFAIGFPTTHIVMVAAILGCVSATGLSLLGCKLAWVTSMHALPPCRIQIHIHQQSCIV